MIRLSRNKNELLVLTGAVYSFVAYLTAFTLEVLFIIDLAKRTNNGFIPTITTSSSLSSYPTTTSSLSTQTSAFISTQSPSASTRLPGISTTSGSYLDDDSIIQPQSAFDQAKLMLETMQSHMTISCLAISILYFIIFVTSLALITALILRSTFFLLIWICAMSAMCLPEFGLIIYVSVYGWGLESRNGQTELLFYLLRAALNVIFIFRAHKLYKDWNYEKNFFMLKSGSSNAIGGSRFFSGYESPYFVGDSLTTTINPVFSSSTLNLDQYDHYRDYHNTANTSNKFSTSTSPSKNYTNYPDYQFQAQPRSGRPRSGYIASNNATRNQTMDQFYSVGDESNQNNNPITTHHRLSIQPQVSGECGHSGQLRKVDPPTQSANTGHESMLSIEDDFPEYEMDLDYRTLTNQHHYTLSDPQNSGDRQLVKTLNRAHQPAGWQHPGESSGRYVNTNSGVGNDIYQSNQTSTGKLHQNQASLSYSTQSLDRRQLRDFELNIPEQVTLRPLGHQPFEYLRRPGSTTNLNSTSNLNTQLTPMYSSNTKLHDLHYRYN